MTDATDSGRPRRVVVLIDILSAGGAERAAVDLAAGLQPDRFCAELLVTQHTGPLEKLARRHGVPITILGRKWGFAPRKFARAVRLVRDADLLHAHKFEGGCWGVLIARFARRPVIVHEQNAYGGEKTFVRTLLYRHWIARGARAIVCVSEDIVAWLLELGVPRSLLHLVPNGVPLAVAIERDAARHELGLATDAFVIGIVARLRKQKRHDILLEATARLRADGRRVVVCIVGDGPERADLERHAVALAIDDALVWTGEMEDPGRLASAFDVSVLSSDFEGMPLAALEAMAAGVPLVATEVGGLPDLLAGGAGVLVPRRNPVALADAIARLADDPAVREAMGRLGQTRVRDRYSLEQSLRAVERVYDVALARSD